MLQFIDTVSIQHKRVLLRVDFNVTLNPDMTIADDYRIRQSIPTIKYLLKNNNTIFLVSHLGRPKGRELKFSLAPMVNYLKALFPKYTITFVDTVETAQTIKPANNSIYFIENIRFYPEEKKNDPAFSEKLSSFVDVYVNDAFGVSHRKNSSIVGITHFIPSYGGLLLKKEIHMMDRVIKDAKHPVVAIIGGAKVSTKIELLEKLMKVADYLLLGGGLANTFFAAQGVPMGSSFYEKDFKLHAEKLLHLSKQHKTELILPSDVILGLMNNGDDSHAVHIKDIQSHETRAILDIGPETQASWGSLIGQAKTIIWNGPLGYIEKTVYSRGTDFVYYSIAQNAEALSVVGGGETLSAISKKEYLDKITHISTGGGAMLEYIEKGTLPGIEALKNNKQ